MWTPYRHLPYYAAERNRSRADTKQRLYQKSVRHARAIARQTVPARWRPESASFEARGLAEPRDIGAFSSRLESFVQLPRSESRRALDEFLLLYFRRGFGLKGAVERAWRDYESVGDAVMEMKLLDVLDYASFFWNFSGASEPQIRAYADAAFLDGSRLMEILEEGRTLIDARVDWGAVQGFEAGKELKRMAMINTRLSQQLSRELMAEEGMGDTQRYKDIASFQRTTMIVTQAAQEIGTNEEEAIELGEFFEDMWDEVDQDIGDYRALESEEISPEDLKEENDEVRDTDTPDAPGADLPEEPPEPSGEAANDDTDARAY